MSEAGREGKTHTHRRTHAHAKGNLVLQSSVSLSISLIFLPLSVSVSILHYWSNRGKITALFITYKYIYIDIFKPPPPSPPLIAETCYFGVRLAHWINFTLGSM